MSAGDFEGGRVLDSIDRVSVEDAAEDQDFGREKYPHAEQRCLLLLFQIVEMMPMSGGVAICHVRQLPRPNTRTCHNRQRAYPRNCVSAAAMAFAIPGQSHAKDWARLRSHSEATKSDTSAATHNPPREWMPR